MREVQEGEDVDLCVCEEGQVGQPRHAHNVVVQDPVAAGQTATQQMAGGRACRFSTIPQGRVMLSTQDARNAVLTAAAWRHQVHSAQGAASQ